MKRISLFFPEPTLKRLANESEKTGLNVSEIVRRAVDAYLKKAEK